MDERAFESLYAREVTALMSYAMRRLGNASDAADVVADTFLVVWRRRDEVPRGAGARPWLFGVARNVIANHDRSTRRRGRLEARLAALVVDLAPDPALMHAEAQDASQVRAALQRLSSDDRELLLLAAWDGLAPRDAARVLGIGGAAARTRLRRARQRLARELEGSAARGAAGGHVRVDGQPLVPARTET